MKSEQERNKLMTIQIDQALDAKVVGIASNMLANESDFAEIPDTDGMALVRKGSQEEARHRGPIKEYPFQGATFVLYHK